MTKGELLELAIREYIRNTLQGYGILAPRKLPHQVEESRDDFILKINTILEEKESDA